MRTRLLAAVAALILVGAVLAVYWPVKDYPFINFDDDFFVTENPLIQRGLTVDRVKQAFADGKTGLWIPLTWLSFMLEADLHGLKPGAMHVTNVLFHAANTLLLFWLLVRMTTKLPESALAAGLFALHPLHVESVAWVTERKDVLSTFFLFLALAAYVGYNRKRAATRYLACLMLYACSLMAKPTFVTLPVLLLLLDFWPLRRLSLPMRRPLGQVCAPPPASRPSSNSSLAGLLAEKAPFFAFSLLATAWNIKIQVSINALAPLEYLSVTDRMAFAAVSYGGYLIKTLWPRDLAILYPHPEVAPSLMALGAAVFVLVSVSAWAATQRERRPFLLVGWGWYLVTLLPVSGLTQSGYQALADRYTYVPLVGIFLVFSLGLSELGAILRRQTAVLAVAGIPVLALCAVASSAQVRLWRNSITLFTHAAAVTENNYVAHVNAAQALLLAGRIDEALAHAQKAVAIQPDFGKAQLNLGIALTLKNNLREAVVHLEEAVRLEPDNWRARKSLENTLRKLRGTRPRGSD